MDMEHDLKLREKIEKQEQARQAKKEAAKTETEPMDKQEGAEPAEPPAQEAQETAKTGFMSDPDVLAFIEKQIEEGIKKALKGMPPKADMTEPTGQEKKAFDKLTYRERLNLYKSNPQTYHKLTRGV
jgi:hypothetical protein